MEAVMNKSLLLLPLLAIAFLSTAMSGQIVRKPHAAVEEQGVVKGNAPSQETVVPNRIATILGVPIPYATITAAIAAATAGDTIEVAAGTFIENVVVNKSVHIRGAGAASTFIKPSFIGANPGGGGSLPAGHSTLFLIEANNVTIEKMTIDGDNPALISGIGKGGADIDARNGIITNHTLGTYNNLTVRNATVKNIYLRGIYASSGGTFTLTDNRVHNVQADSIGFASIGIFNFGGSGLIQRDTVSDCLDAIAANHSKGTQFLDNIVTGSGSGVHSDNSGDAGGVADLIQGNNVSNSTLYGYGIWVFVPYIAPTFNNNSVTNVDVGMGSFAGAFGPTVTPVFTNNTIDGQNKPGSTGFYITNTTWYYGLTNVATTFTNNIIKNNVDGVYIESGSGYTVTFTATSNAIQSNTGTGVLTGAVPIAYGNPSGLPGTLSVNLTSNWWGSSTGPLNASTNPSGTGNSIDNALDYSPWWGADYRSVAHPWNWYVNTSNSSTIQEAVGLASAGDVINIAAATYAERVTVNKSLTLQGAGELTTILNGSGLVGSGSGITINNAITNVSIKDMTVKNYAGTSPNSYAGIYAVGGNNNLTVLNVTLKDNVGGSGFYANGPVNGITLDNLDVSGHPNTFGAARGIVIWNGLKENISITNSDVYNNNCCGIELQDGTASGVTLQNNNIHDNGDNGIGLVGLQGPGENLVKKNTVTNNGRFGIEIKNPNGSGAASGPGRVVVDSNTVTRTLAIVDLRDIVGIAAFRRSVLAGNVDVPVGAVISNNTVSGYTQASSSDGFGIVVEGMNHTVSGNTVTGCDVGIQRQYGHTPYPGDGDQSNLADTYFGRGNSPVACGINVTGNTLSGNTLNTRDVGTGIDAGVVTNTNTSENFCTIQSAINDAQTLNGHTLRVGTGTYNEQVLVSKSLTIKAVSATAPVVNFTGTVTGKPALFDISADAVTVDSLRFNVDLSKLRSAIIATSAGLDNITITNNVVDAYGTPAGSYGDRNAVSINYGGPTNYRVATGGVDNILFQGNTVNGSLPTSFFRAAVAVDEGGGTFSGNTLQTINHDVLVRFGSNGNVTVTGNNLNGGGVELNDMNAGAGILTVAGNIFDGTFANSSAPGTAVLRLKNNYNSKTTPVTGNTFSNHQWAVSLENYNSVTLDNNTFTPLAASTTYHHVVINTKSISSNSSSITQVPIGAVLTNNTFNGSGTPGGTALTFMNHDSNAASFGTLTIGTAGNENKFNAGIANVISLDNQSGTSSGATFPAYTSLIGAGPGALTTMTPWTVNLNAVNNKYDVGSGLELPSAMSLTNLFALEDKIQHSIDAAGLGFVTEKANNNYVTINSFYPPATTAPSIQLGVDAASAGWTVNVGPGNFPNDVNINKSVTLKGQGIDVTTITGPKTGPNGATVRISTTGIVVEGFTITRDGNNVTDWPTNVKLAGIAIQGLTASAEIRNNKITGNRTAIDINLSSGNYIHNNIIDFNRSGLILRNQCTGNTIAENDVTNNWTVGILWLAASTEDATGTVFFNNKIEGNWYAQIENRSLTGGAKNFSGNWLGATSLATANTNGAEPGYAALIPVLYGGASTPPGGAMNVRGVGIADMDYTPWLNSNTDTDVDNGTGIIGFQGSFSTLWVDDNDGQYGSTPRIQEGVNLVSGSTINVMPGSYRGQVYINEPNLNLVSVAGPESTFVLPSLTLMPQPFLPARLERPVIGVDSLGTNVVIDGFTVDGEGAGGTHTYMTGIQYFKGTGIVRNNTIKRVRNNPFDGAQMFIGILVNHDYPRSYTHAVEIHNDSVYDFGKGGIVCNHPGTTGDVHDNVVIGQGPTGLNAQVGIQFGFGSTGTIADNVVDNISYTTPGTTASSILGFVTDGTLSVHGNSISQGQAAINLQQSTSYPLWSANANVYDNTITASAAGTGVSSYYGGILMSAGGPAPAQPRVRGASPGKASPADIENSRGTQRLLQPLNAMSVSFAGNTLTSSTPSDGTGLYLLALDTSPLTVTGDSNQFTGYGVGVVTDKDPGATLNSTWRRNKFLGNNYGMYDLTGVLQDAKNNWWNNASGPRDVKSLPATPNYNNTGGLGDSVTAFIDYNPWYLDLPMTLLSQYTLSVTTVAHGTVTKTPDQPLYLHGTLVQLAAVPTAGYAFVGWTGDTTTAEDTIDVDMSSNKSYTATFTNRMNITVVGNGTVTKTPDQPTGYAPGAIVGVKATPDPGWHFVSWSGDTTTAADTLSVALYADKNYTATFAINTYALNIVIAGSGSVNKLPNQPLYNHGSPVTLTAVPGGSYSFVGWTGDTVTANNPITITMDTVKNLIATFIGDKFLTITPESLVATGVNGRLLKPARRNRDPFPNWMNLLEETVVQGGFQPNASESDTAGAMRIGVSWMRSIGGGRFRPLHDSALVHGWVRLTKWRPNVNVGVGYTSIPKSLKDRTGMHTGPARGLDFIPAAGNPQAHVLVGEKLSLPPKRHNNKLFAEMVALKVNIAASQLGKMPVGFGDLIFNQPGNPVSGLTLTQLSGRIDTALTMWLGRATADYDSFYSAVYRINRAFPGAVDTASWLVGNKLILNGDIRVGTIPFLQAPPVPPTILPITTDLTESDDEFDESEFEDADGTPIAVKLQQNYPNPFNPGTTISFGLRGPSLVTLKLYDILGREVGTLLNNEELEEGEQMFEFLANNLATGTYLYRIEATSIEDPSLMTVETRKMLLLK